MLEFKPIIDKQHFLRMEKGSSDGINTLTRSIFFMLYIIIMVYLTIRPVARKGYGSIAHEAKPNGLLTRGP